MIQDSNEALIWNRDCGVVEGEISRARGWCWWAFGREVEFVDLQSRSH